jgi:cell pole-organizing protein PopZ
MDEILASIRQIISEDLASVAAAERNTGQADEDEVLILNERAPPEPSPFAPSPVPHVAETLSESQASDADAHEVRAESRPNVPETPEAERPEAEHSEPETSAPERSEPEAVGREFSGADPEPEASAGRSLTVAASLEPTVVAPETAAVVAASFERLSFVVENTPPPPPFAISPGGVTLEDITRDILAPVIKTWLDENLPGIVRARVDEEVERITRSRVR